MRLAQILLATFIGGLSGCCGPVTRPVEQSSADRVQRASIVSQRPAPLFDDLGNLHYPITTRSEMAQRYFDQGLTLVYAFNHAEAIRSFEAAASEDPTCAMAWWGVALAYGPNINAPMTDDAVPKAYAALQKAIQLAGNASEKEQAYIRALTKRYGPAPVKDHSALDKAYADAMREVYQQFPDDLNAATLFAEAIMDTMPWDYWTKEKQPKPATVELIQVLDSVRARDLNHIGANHYYIHTVEAGPAPQQGLAAADRLAYAVPGAGHLVHMPGHIYLRVGLYHEASEANVRAARADESYIAQCNAQGFYPATYYPHNLHFLWYTTAMEGRSADSIAAARKIAGQMSHHSLSEGTRFEPLVLMAMARFGHWDPILAAPQPPEEQLFESAMSHFARGLALAAKGQVDAAQREQAALQRIADDERIKPLDTPTLPGAQLIALASHALAGEVALRQGRREEGIRQWRMAVKAEDDLPYMEPPYAYFPMRHWLGAALLDAGKPAEAEAVYREDLKNNPNNGWALFGLVQSLQAQGKDAQAAETRRQFASAWMRADVTPSSSRF